MPLCDSLVLKVLGSFPCKGINIFHTRLDIAHVMSDLFEHWKAQKTWTLVVIFEDL